MEDDAPVELLWRDIEVWNKWKQQNYLKHVRLTVAQLSEAKLAKADPSDVDLLSADLSGADLRGADLTMARVTSARLTRANLSGASLLDTDLSAAELSGADLTKAGLSGTKFIGTSLVNTNFAGALMRRCVFDNVDLSKTLGLDAVQHWGPSTVGIDTLFRSEGHIPVAFLRGAGVPDPMVAYIASLVLHPIHFYSAFISYSSKDYAFTERLHADLQQKHVHVWFAPEDLKIGDKFRTRIDEAIRVYDKLMVVLSNNSVASPWVEDEVEAALEKERREHRTVLFPIRLDDAVIKTDQAWAASIRRTRHIGDFNKWKDHDEYLKAFGRLLRDLQTDNPRPV